MSRTDIVALGPFDLLGLAGRGGMGVVWRGVHRVRRLPVAIKCLRPGPDADAWRVQFLREVQAIARLDHPGIVPLHAFGSLPRAVPMAEGEMVQAGTPYLVMDWIAGGALSTRTPTDWPGLRRILLELLEALAHAHARGVVHRDVKPANVLLQGDRPVLTDFGLALHDPDGADLTGGGVSGTPGFMAPEQAAGQGWRVGPWTDLYAVGCLGWALACGRSPFSYADPREQIRATRRSTLPPFAPRVAVPPAFEAWLQHLLAPAPEHRPPSAAHARFDLPPADAAVVRDVASNARGTGGPTAVDSTAVEHSTTVPDTRPSRADTAVAGTAPMPGLDPASDRPEPTGDVRLLAAPLPADWRGPAHTPALFLDSAGETVADLRDPPLRGRDAERDRLWAALRAAANGEGGRAVVLAGDAGVGKSRLARWLAERAHQTLGARTLTVRHAPTPQPGTGPRATLARALYLTDPRHRRHRVRRALPDAPDLAAAALALFDADGAATVDGVRVCLRDDGQRIGAIAQLLAWLASRRLLVVHIEDAHWADEALRLMTLVLRRMPEAPIVWLVTTRTGVGSGVSAHVADTPRVETLAVPPLGRDALTAALRHWLPLSISTVERVVQRAGGCPQYAVEVVRARLRRGALVPGPAGLRLRTVALPADLDQVWRDRLVVELDRMSPAAGRALELAALLGIEVDDPVWRAATAHLDPTGASAAEALATLLAAGLVRADGEGRWRFGHPTVREALLHRGAAGRVDGHRRCADALLERLPADADSATRLRVGAHLLAAGRADAALGHLLTAGQQAVERRDFARVPRIVLAGARALRALGRPMSGPAGVELRILWSHPHPSADPRRARRHVRRAVRDAAALGDPGLEARATAMLSNLWITPSPAEALPHGRRAAELVAATGDPLLEFESRMRLAYLLRSVGRLDDARAELDAAERLAVPDTPLFRVRPAVQRALITQYGGDVEAARRLLDEAADDVRAAGDVQVRIQCAVTLGEMARSAGDLEAAERHYREAGRLGRLTGHAGGDFNAINLGLVLIARRRFGEARRHLEATRVHLERTGVPVGIWLVNLALLPCDAVERDWTRWDARWIHFGAFLDGRFVDPDIADIALTAAAEAEAASAPERADAAWQLAEVQLAALGRDAKLARVRAERAAAAARRG